MDKNSRAIENIFIELTKMKETIASLKEEVETLREDNKKLRKSLSYIDRTNIIMLDKICPDWRNSAKKKSENKKPVLRLVK